MQKNINYTRSTRLNQIEIYDENIIELFMSNQNLLKLIKYTDENPLSKPDVSGKDLIQLKNANFFNAPIMPPQDMQKTIICYYFDNFVLNNTNNFYKNSFIIIDIFMFNKLIKISNGNRMYKIINQIDGLLNNNRNFGIGQLKFTNGHWMHFYPNNSINFVDFQFAYQIIDEN